MKCTRFNITLSVILLVPLIAVSQTDNDPPATPALDLVTVNPGTGTTDLEWTRSISDDVEGYVMYYFRNNEGTAFDTIWNPFAASYTNIGSAAAERIESYVIAAIDTAGNISPLSNALNTIFTQSQVDECNNKIIIKWNSYTPVPHRVRNYRIFSSKNGAPYIETGTVPPESTTFITGDFTTGNQYRFYVEADLEEGFSSLSSKTLLQVNIQRPPEWINADYATINNDNEIELSFTIDPFSEIKTFRIERKEEAENEFTSVSMKESSGGKVYYKDQSADILKRYRYRLAAINNCGNSVVQSNIAGNIILNIKSDGNVFQFAWNGYHEWDGAIENYKIFMDIGDGFVEKSLLLPSDTLYILNYSDLMYDISTDKACFQVAAYEIYNQHDIAGESRSNIHCIEILEKITVPNTFTPDNDLLNDYFRPVLSFTPVTYKLIISDRNNNIVFETTDPLESWDGLRSGSPLPQGVYLWILRTDSPSGNSFSRSGTVAIIRNR